MDTKTAWQNLDTAIDAMNQPTGDYQLKLATISAGVELLYEHPADKILKELETSAISTRALVSWLVFEGGRLHGVPDAAVVRLKRLYETSSGQTVLAALPQGMLI